MIKNLRKLLPAVCAMALAWGGMTGARAGDSIIALTLERHKPCNLFQPEEAVTIPAKLRCKQGGTAEVTITATDYYGKVIAQKKQTVELPANQETAADLSAGALPTGYYTLGATVILKDATGKTLQGRGGTTLCVTPFVNRTGKEALDRGSRFGLKVWLLGSPGVWWRRPLVWDVREVTDATRKMGLQWTRNGIGPDPVGNEPGVIGTQEMVRDFQMNSVLKLEGFPESCFDTARYGPLETFRKDYPAWMKCTLPLEKPYRDWLREQLKYAPAGQNVFEIWNEPWQWQWKKTLTADDFAKLCQWTREVVKQERPGALIGPNILGGHGEDSYDERFMDAGGMAGMDLVAIHPYASATPEDKGFRQRLRNYHDLLKKKLGHDLPLYTTEYGWSTAPQNPKCVNETEQARRTVRESLMLYAEDVKTLIPHWMGDREHDPKDDQHWFGFFHITQEPKPVVAAFATCARMIDSSRFLGDLWYGPGVGAMLFERGGATTLALWTDSADKKITVETGAEKVQLVNMMGRAADTASPGGKLTLTVGPDVVYLVGVGKNLVASADKPGSPLRDERWTTRKDPFTIPRLAQAPVIDGQLADWAGVTPQKLANPKLQDLAADVYLGWQGDRLCLAARVEDTSLVNANPPGRIAAADVLLVSLCPRPERQVGGPELYDYTLQVSPVSESGAPVCRVVNQQETREIKPGADPSGVVWKVSKDDKGWIVEASLPFSLLAEMKPLPGYKMSGKISVMDRDNPDPQVNEWKQWNKRVETTGAKSPHEFPYFILGE